MDFCLVTGGAGFIGSHLVEWLAGRGYPTRVLDDFSTGQRDNLAPISGIELMQADVADADAVTKAMMGIDVVFHLAALASVQASVENPAATHRICATGTLNVLDAARKAGVRRVVYAGSASAYGIPTDDVQSESEPTRPLSPYAAAKLAGEEYLQAFAASYGLETVTLRFFNIFGPRQRADSPYSGVIAIFAGIMTAGRTPTIYGDGLQSRDFTYVADVVQALTLARKVPNAVGQVYNVGTGRSVSLLDLVAALNRLLGTDITPKHGPDRAGDIRHSRADISRARREMGYEPMVAFEDGLRETLRWYREANALPG
jgi:UDP-glucose 4-epimerase